jgi:hypothetical protein
MQWQDIRQHYPHQWLLVEAITAHSAYGLIYGVWESL